MPYKRPHGHLEFGHGAYVRGRVEYRMSPFSINFLKKPFLYSNMWRRFKAFWPIVLPIPVGVIGTIWWIEELADREKRKHPGEFDHET